MSMDRRRFIGTTGAAVAGTILGTGAPVRDAAGRAGDADGDGTRPGGGRDAVGRPPTADERPDFDPADWGSVRAQFPLAEDEIDLSAMYITSHPWPVRDAIAEHGRDLDRRPTRHLMEANDRLTARSREAAAAYLGGRAADVALVDSTTMGIGLLYSGIDLSDGQEALTTEHDYYVTHESLRLATRGSGARVRKIPLYEDHPAGLAPDQVVEAVASAVGPATRVVALTWVHSGTGLKLPLRKIAARIRRDTADRAASDRPILCVDGVHGFGVEDVDVADLGFDFFAAGCHKWLFGPRGTGIVWGDGDAWRWIRPSTPSFMAGEPWRAWFEDRAPRGRTTGARFSPGGFKPFEHRWALAEAFAFHQSIGRQRVAERTRALVRRLKEGLHDLGHVRLVTPLDDEVSAGIVCFDVDGESPWEVVRSLGARGIVATVTPYAVRHVRLSPSIRNSEAEVDAALDAVASMGPARVAAPLSVE